MNPLNGKVIWFNDYNDYHDFRCIFICVYTRVCSQAFTHVCCAKVCSICAQVPMKSRRRFLIPWSWSYRRVTVILAPKLSSSTRTVSTFNQ